MSELWKNILAGILTALTFVFGDMDGLMIALIVLIVIDYISGVIAAAVQQQLSSAVGAKGIAKKIFMLLIVAVANIVDVNVIGTGAVLRNVAMVFYICNECISLVENAGKIGVPVPKKLLDVLAQLKSEADSDDDNNGNIK